MDWLCGQCRTKLVYRPYGYECPKCYPMGTRELIFEWVCHPFAWACDKLTPTSKKEGIDGFVEDSLNGCGMALLMMVVLGILFGGGLVTLVLWACGVF